MVEDILKIIKQWDDWQFTVEIKDNAKGEPQVTVKTRSDATAENTGEEAIKECNRIRKALQK